MADVLSVNSLQKDGADESLKINEILRDFYVQVLRWEIL